MHVEKQYSLPIVAGFLRLLFYAAILFGISELVFLDSATVTETGKFGEDSFTEWAQEIFILLSSLLFFIAGRYDKNVTGFTGMLSGMAMMAFIREFNNYFHTLFMGAWQLLVLIALIITIVYVYRNRETWVKPFYEFLSTPAFGVILTGFLIVMVYSRLFGRGTVWRAILAVNELEGPTRWAKNAAEEGTELLGYAFLFIGTLEYCWYIIDKKRRSKSIAGN